MINLIIAIKKKCVKNILKKDNLSKQANSGYNVWTLILCKDSGWI